MTSSSRKTHRARQIAIPKTLRDQALLITDANSQAPKPRSAA
jgi:hypothetical protein